MSNQLSKPQLLQAVTCILGLEDGDAGLTRLAEELAVALNPWSKDNQQFALCRQEVNWGVGILVPAGGAGFRSIAQIHNDSTDDLVDIDGFLCAGGGAAYFIARTSALATTDGGLIAFARDGRFPKPAPPSVRIRTQNGVALPAPISNGQMYGDMPLLQLFECHGSQFTLRPQGTLAFYPSADNVSLRVNVWGSVRRTETKRELTP